LSGSILYTLIAREAGLDVNGMITPGHAFAVFNDKTGRKVQIEVTAEPMFEMTREQGFDVDWWEQFKVLNRVNAYGGLRRGTSNRIVGEISPESLTAYQFLNSLVSGVMRITEKYKDEREYAKDLHAMVIQNNREWQTEMKTIAERYRQDPKKATRLAHRAIDKHLKKRRALRKEIRDIGHKISKETNEYAADVGLDLMEKALGIAPSVEEFWDLMEGIHMEKAELVSRPAEEARRDRIERAQDLTREMHKKMFTLAFEQNLPGGEKSNRISKIKEEIKAYSAKIEAIENEAKEKWKEEKEYWLSSLKTLDEAMESFPCSAKIKRLLEALCWNSAKMCEGMEDIETLYKVVGIGVARMPDSDFAKFYRDREF
jgi:hypothetical protein